MNLFLFPHQDDEAPVFHEIDRLVQDQQPLVIVYLTTGQASPDPCERRNQESLAVLASLGVKRDQIHFMGALHGVADGKLQDHLDDLHLAITNLIGSQAVECIYMPAWEGGHHDHDAAHLLGLALARQWQCIESSRQFPYYHGEGLSGILFKTLKPLSQNGRSITANISVFKRMKYLALLSQYKSQLRTWIGLGPFFALHYLIQGTQVLQPVSTARAHQRPHLGPMLYERRAFCDFESFQRASANFRRKHLN